MDDEDGIPQPSDITAYVVGEELGESERCGSPTTSEVSSELADYELAVSDTISKRIDDENSDSDSGFEPLSFAAEGGMGPAESKVSKHFSKMKPTWTQRSREWL